MLLKVSVEQQLIFLSFIANFARPHKIEFGGACNKEESNISGTNPHIKALV